MFCIKSLGMFVICLSNLHRITANMPNPNTTVMFYIQQKYLMKSCIVFEGAFHNLTLSRSHLVGSHTTTSLTLMNTGNWKTQRYATS
jgi:hypothetical protein